MLNPMSELTPVIPLVDVGLGNSTYLVDLGDRRALVVDPSRDLRAVQAAAAARGLRVVYAAETHLHADFVSGSMQLAANGAQVLASTSGGRAFAHRGLADEEGVDLGGLTLRALTTPGHTAEHLSYLLSDGATLLGAFTGGSLLVGAAAAPTSPAPSTPRPSPGPSTVPCTAWHACPTAPWSTPRTARGPSARPHPEPKARAASASRKQPTPTWPPLTRTRSSPCSWPAWAATRPTLSTSARLTGRGQSCWGPPTLRPLSVKQVMEAQEQGAQIVDTRQPVDFAAGRIPGSLSIALRPVFATWLGWLIDPQRPVIIVRSPDQDPDEILWAAGKVGFDALAGELDGGFPARKNSAAAATGSLLEAGPLVSGIEAFAALLDIRQASEYAAGHVAGARNLALGELANHLDELPAGRLVVMCGHGERAMSAASILHRAGRAEVAVLDGGPADWAQAAGRPLESGR